MWKTQGFGAGYPHSFHFRPLGVSFFYFNGKPQNILLIPFFSSCLQGSSEQPAHLCPVPPPEWHGRHRLFHGLLCACRRAHRQRGKGRFHKNKSIQNISLDVADTYLIIVTDAADAVSVNFSGRCKFLQI